LDVKLQTFVGLSPIMANEKRNSGSCWCFFIQCFMMIV